MERFANQVLKRSKCCLLVIIAVSLAFAGAVLRVQIDDSVERMLIHDHPDRAYYRDFLARYGSDELVIVGFQVPRLFSTPVLELIRRISTSLGQITLESEPEEAPNQLIEQVVSELDIAVPQIRIEAKLLEVDTDRINQLGLTWDLFGDGRTALKLSYGKYYEPVWSAKYNSAQIFGANSVNFYWYDDGNKLMDLPGIDRYVPTAQPNQDPNYTYYPSDLKPPYMHELMAASDVAVAKCGGLTSSECLAMGLPMVIAIVLFLAYYFFGVFSGNYAKEGNIHPVLGAWLPTMIMLPLGIWLTRRATADKGLMSFGHFIDFWKERMARSKKKKSTA